MPAGRASVSRARLLALSSLLAAAPASAQETCVYHSYGEGGEIVFEDHYSFDAAGRVTRADSTNDAAAFSAQTVYRYDARGELVEERVNVLEGPSEDDLGWAPPTVVTTTRTETTVTVRRAGARPELTSVQVWSFDARGLPARIEVSPASEGGGESDEYYCAFDIAGRPVYLGWSAGPSRRIERRWIWSGDTLVGVERAWTSQGQAGESSQRVRRRGGSITWVTPLRDGIPTPANGSRRRPTVTSRRSVIQLVERDGAVSERWAGRCDQLLFGLCSPILGPLPAGGARATLPPSAGQRVRRPRGRGGLAFPEAVLSAPLTLASLRAAYPSRAVSTRVGFYENAPETPYAFVCIGSERAPCLTTIEHDDRAQARTVSTRDPTLVGPAGIRVGARYRRVAARLERCEIRRGLVEGIACRVREAPEVEVWLHDEVPSAENLALTEELLAARRVVRMEWSSALRVNPGASGSGGSPAPSSRR